MFYIMHTYTIKMLSIVIIATDITYFMVVRLLVIPLVWVLLVTFSICQDPGEGLFITV